MYTKRADEWDQTTVKAWYASEQSVTVIGPAKAMIGDRGEREIQDQGQMMRKASVWLRRD